MFSGRAFSAYRSSDLSPKELAAFLRPSAQSQKETALLYISSPDGYMHYIFLNDRSLKRVLPEPDKLHISDIEKIAESGNLLSLTMTSGSDKGPITAGAFYQRINRDELFFILKPLFPALFLFALLLIFLIFGASSKGSQEKVVTAKKAIDHKETRMDAPFTPYSPETGLSWESFLNERLTNELKRSAQSEQELSFTLIYCPNFKDPSVYSQMAKKLKRVFTMGDLVFEYTLKGVKAFAVILPDTDLMVSIDLVKEFLNDADLSKDRCRGGATAGLSSRSGRLVDASILIKEATAALSRAEKDPETNIIGFKPDPGKFRNYLAAKREKQ